MDDCVVIGLYRHGITTANEKRAYCGWADAPLSERGKEDLRAIQPFLPDYETVIASDLKRCADTASLLFPEAKVELWKGFREMNFGLWEGKVHHELEHLAEYRAWVNDPFSSLVPQGESYQQFGRRVRSAWRQWLAFMDRKQMKRGAIVTHGGVIRYLLSEAAPERKSFWDWKVENGRGYELTASLSSLRRGERCISLQAVPSTERRNG
ncbi:histidine phosphatase family protein [Bacillus xiapuensis]|uniref:histidine phosphatase family protein n=1 Tax=Bacillus xiapuensis TaxID=2014075 RepID=UPI000C231558|nr:histidine phosphatase family protein [Bacillus xiapuensis]